MDLTKVPLFAWMLLCLACLMGTLLMAVREGRRRHTVFTRLRALLQLPQTKDDAAFALQDRISGLLFTDNTFYVVDLRDGGSLVQRLRLDQVALLKIYETTKDYTPFRLVTHHQAETRRIETPSIISLNSLVNLMSACGARIEYIPEDI